MTLARLSESLLLEWVFLFKFQLVILLVVQTAHFLHFMLLIPNLLDSLLHLQRLVTHFLGSPLRLHPLRILVLHSLVLPRILHLQAQFIHLLDSLGILHLRGQAVHFLGSLLQLHPLQVLALHSLVLPKFIHFLVQLLQHLSSLILKSLQRQVAHFHHLPGLNSLMIQFVQLLGLLVDFRSIPLFLLLVADLRLLPLLYHH